MYILPSIFLVVIEKTFFILFFHRTYTDKFLMLNRIDPLTLSCVVTLVGIVNKITTKSRVSRAVVV